MDAALFSLINGTHAPWLDAVMRAASWLGYFPGIWFIAAIVALAWPRLRAAAFRAFLAVALAYVMASGVVKPMVGRVRPHRSGLAAVRTIETAPATSYSFPSGHAATAVAGALAGTRLVPAAAPALWALATLVAVSRVYAGVHYPSDVVAGAVLGALCAYLVLGGRHPSTRPWPASGATATSTRRL